MENLQPCHILVHTSEGEARNARQRLETTLNGMGVIEDLRPLANAVGIRGSSRKPKSEIVAALLQRRHAQPVNDALCWSKWPEDEDTALGLLAGSLTSALNRIDDRTPAGDRALAVLESEGDTRRFRVSRALDLIARDPVGYWPTVTTSFAPLGRTAAPGPQAMRLDGRLENTGGPGLSGWGQGIETAQRGGHVGIWACSLPQAMATAVAGAVAACADYDRAESKPEPKPEPDPQPEPVPDEPQPSPDLFKSPAPKPDPAPATGLAGALSELIEPLITHGVAAHLEDAGVTRDAVAKIIREEVARASVPRTTKVLGLDGEARDVGITHPQFDSLVKLVSIDQPTYVHGPSASGKTFAIHQAAKALNLAPCILACSQDMEVYAFSGFRNANGGYDATEFRRAWEGTGEFEGGALIFIDEFDRAPGGVAIAFNQALDGSRSFVFPDGAIKRHPRTRLVMAGNTLGLGADGAYAAGERLDASTRDRCAFLPWDYDNGHEDAVSDAIAGAHGLDIAKARDWREYVRAVRAAVAKLGLDYVVSPRATYDGTRMLAAGLKLSDVRTFAVWARISSEDHQPIKSALKEA